MHIILRNHTKIDKWRENYAFMIDICTYIHTLIIDVYIYVYIYNIYLFIYYAIPYFGSRKSLKATTLT